ncbi:MAG: competence/damage-inducible protein A [Fimbriimonadaceae bacterium]
MLSSVPPTSVEVVSIGTELLLGEIVDTNAQYLGILFKELGIRHFHRQTVGDNVERMHAAIALALGRSDVVVTIGGLGPTKDDATRKVLESFTGEWFHDPELEADIRSKISGRGLLWSEAQLVQARRPKDSLTLKNTGGTAPGLIIEYGQKFIVCLPGPRSEFKPMVDKELRRWLETLPRFPIKSKTLKLCGIGESIVAKEIDDLVDGIAPSVATYAKPGEVHVRIASMEADPALSEAQIFRTEMEIRNRLNQYVFGTDNETLEQVTAAVARRHSWTLATAESCTGGMLGERITRVPGASDVYAGGVVTYSNELKKMLLGVEAETLRKFGAVSEDTAREMAEGCRVRIGSDWALSVTGVAGPEGGTEDKPVGLVFIGCAGPQGTSVKEHRFLGSRDQVRQRSTAAALCLLWNELLHQ